MSEMSDQKYYVLLKNLTGQPIPIQLCRFGFCGELVDFAKPKLARGNYLLKGPTQRFTKSELAEVMNGGLYKEIKGLAEYEADTLADSKTGWSYTDEIITDIEWINPLIELVPVEEE